MVAGWNSVPCKLPVAANFQLVPGSRKCRTVRHICDVGTRLLQCVWSSNGIQSSAKSGSQAEHGHFLFLMDAVPVLALLLSAVFFKLVCSCKARPHGVSIKVVKLCVYFVSQRIPCRFRVNPFRIDFEY